MAFQSPPDQTCLVEFNVPITVVTNPRGVGGMRPPNPSHNEVVVPNLGAHLGVTNTVPQANVLLPNAIHENNTQKSGPANPSAIEGIQVQNLNHVLFPTETQSTERLQSQTKQKQSRSQQHMNNRTPHLQSSANDRVNMGHDGQHRQSHFQPRQYANSHYGARQMRHETRSELSFREARPTSRNANEHREVAHPENVDNLHHTQQSYVPIQNIHEYSQHVASPIQNHYGNVHTNTQATDYDHSSNFYANTQTTDYGHSTNFHANGSSEHYNASGPIPTMQTRTQHQSSYNPPHKLFLKLIEPQPFSGDKHIMSAIEFLDELDPYQAATGYTERKMVIYVIPHFLKGEAQQWWVSSQIFAKFTSNNEGTYESRIFKYNGLCI